MTLTSNPLHDAVSPGLTDCAVNRGNGAGEFMQSPQRYALARRPFSDWPVADASQEGGLVETSKLARMQEFHRHLAQ